MKTNAIVAISKPTITKDATGYYFGWSEGDEKDVAIGISHISENYKQHTITAEIEVGLDGYKFGNGSKPAIALLTHARTNLLSLSSRQTIVNTIKNSCFIEELIYYPWEKIISQVINITVNDLRKGDPVVELGLSPEYPEPEYVIYPLLIKNTINTFYADRSSAKTLFVSLLDIVMSLPWTDNPLNFNIGNKASKVLYLDWESNQQVMETTYGRLLKGTGIGFCPTHYRHCALPLSEDIGAIKTIITKEQIDVIIIDSLGMAVGDDLNPTAPAFQFFSALRQLEPVTSILIGHTAKNIEGRRKTVYGNAYYENEARNIWEIKKNQEPHSPELNITLFHRKPPPFAGIHEPLAYRFTFDNQTTQVSLGVANIDDTQNETSGIDIVLAIIAESEVPLEPKEIYELTEQEINKNSILQYCYRLKNAGKIKKVEGGYVITK